MSYYLFDNPKTGILIALMLEFLLVMAWVIVRERIKKPLLLIGPGLVGLFVLLDVLVQTNREALEEATRKMVQAAEDEDAERIIDLISGEFSHGSIDKDRVAYFIRRHFDPAKPLIESNRVTRLEVEKVSEQKGTVEFTVITTTDQRSEYGYQSFIKTKWRFEYVKDPDGQYRVIDLIMTNFGDSEGLNVYTTSRLDR
jgi:hypothetical protein